MSEKDNKDNKTCQEFLPVVKKRLENSSIKPNKSKKIWHQVKFFGLVLLPLIPGSRTYTSSIDLLSKNEELDNNKRPDWLGKLARTYQSPKQHLQYLNTTT